MSVTPLELGQVSDPYARRALEQLALQRAKAAASASTPDATTTSKGIVQLAGDLAGTAALPQIAAGVIVDADISPTAAIARSKLAVEIAPFCRVRATVAGSNLASVAVPQTTTPFNFPTPAYQGDSSMWDPATGRLNITKTGRWLIGFEFVWGTESATGTRDCLLGLSSGARAAEDRAAGSTAVNVWLKGSDVADLTQGDYLRLFPSQNSGGPMSVVVAVANAPRMYAHYLGPSS